MQHLRILMYNSHLLHLKPFAGQHHHYPPLDPEVERPQVQLLPLKNYLRLLMLSEISNELQNGEELGYVSEVLARVGLVPHAGYAGGQDSFRNSIMKEYNYELMMECHGWFNNRRRGYDYFIS